jgi:hypothetical protein
MDNRIPKMTPEDIERAQAVLRPGTHEQRVETRLTVIAWATGLTGASAVLAAIVLLVR